MTRKFLVSVFLILAGASAVGAPKNIKYKVKLKVFDQSVKANVGDKIELTLSQDSVSAVDKTCARTRRNTNGDLDCEPEAVDIVAAQFPPSAITQLVAGKAANFVSLIWTAAGKKAWLIAEPDGKEFDLVVASLEELTGKKALSADDQPAVRPRVFLDSQSFGNQWNAVRSQSMEMAKDLGTVCPIALVTINEQKADFTIRLNHIERGLVIRDNQIEVFNKDGDLITGKEGGSILGGVTGTCALITTSWAIQAER